MQEGSCKMRDMLRFALGLVVVGAFIALLVLERPTETVAALAPLASMVIFFFFRKGGPPSPPGR